MMAAGDRHQISLEGPEKITLDVMMQQARPGEFGDGNLGYSEKCEACAGITDRDSKGAKRLKLGKKVEKISNTTQDNFHGVEESPYFGNTSLPFLYDDMDELSNELAELYGVYEMSSSFPQNQCAFLELQQRKKFRNWSQLSRNDLHNIIDDLLDELEVLDQKVQYNALLILNHLVQGCWRQFRTLDEQLECMERNVRAMIICNAVWRVWAFVSPLLLNVELHQYDYDGTCVEMGLNILCTIMIFAVKKRILPFYSDFVTELRSLEGENLLLALFNATLEFGKETLNSFMYKKVLLLIRSLLLLILGGSNELRTLKVSSRRKAGLETSFEDTITTCQSIEPIQNGIYKCGSIVSNCLSWTPKSSLEKLRACQLGYGLLTCEDEDTKAQFHSYSQSTLNSLIQYLYIPLGDFQKEQEKLIIKYPLNFSSQEISYSEVTESLFFKLVPILESVVGTFVGILSEASPTKVLRRCDPFIPTDFDGHFYSRVEDSKRQCEIVAKSISAILILLLKHTKMSHIYQHECIFSLKVTQAFIPVCLRYFSRHILRYVYEKPKISYGWDCRFEVLNAELAANTCFSNLLNSASEVAPEEICWRNMFCSINLLRVLNKAVKGKPMRVQILKMFKAHHVLAKSLLIPDSLFQQYALKLLKQMCKYLSPRWKRSHLYAISAIYTKVRHRKADNWIGDMTSYKPKKTDAEKKILSDSFLMDESFLERNRLCYVKRKLQKIMATMNEKVSPEQIDLPIPDLSESFKKNYEQWLESEVFEKQYNWDSLLSPCTINSQ